MCPEGLPYVPPSTGRARIAYKCNGCRIHKQCVVVWFVCYFYFIARATLFAGGGGDTGGGWPRNKEGPAGGTPGMAAFEMAYQAQPGARRSSSRIFPTVKCSASEGGEAGGGLLLTELPAAFPSTP